MKLWTLIENTACREDLAAEHGLSLYIETDSHRILFDTGKTGAFADNAEKMGVDLSRVDICILSHGHYDHGGGLKRFLKINKTAPVYLRPEAFGAHYSSGNYIGLDPALEGEARLRYTAENQLLAPGLSLRSCNGLPRPFPFGVFGQTLRRNGNDIPDRYLHEQYLLIEEAGKRYCISGCSHKGVLNILHWFRPDVFIGGFHFIKMEPHGQELAAATRQLAAFDTRYYTGHCTGSVQFDIMKESLGDRLEYISAGTMLTL